MKKLLAGAIVFLVSLSFSAGAQDKLTKGDVVKMLSASEQIKKRIGDLVSWTVGYDISKVNRAKLTPVINYVRVVPTRVQPDGRTVVEIIASVDDPGGLGNISGVRADLSSIGRLPNTILVDNGMFGDRRALDGVYTLQTTVPSDIAVGEKEVPVAATNKKGWMALSKASLDVTTSIAR